MIPKLPAVMHHDKEFIQGLTGVLSSCVINEMEDLYGPHYALWQDKDFVR